MCSQVAPAGLPPPLDELSLMKVYVADGPFKLEYFLSLLNDLRPPGNSLSLVFVSDFQYKIETRQTNNWTGPVKPVNHFENTGPKFIWFSLGCETAEIASLIANVFNGQTTCLELISACRIRANPEALQQWQKQQDVTVKTSLKIAVTRTIPLISLPIKECDL